MSTEAVSADKASELESLIAIHYGDACIVEMEGFGSLFAAARERTPAIVIRGVSDMAEFKEPETDKVRQPIAAAHAAAFAFELIARWTEFYPGALALPTHRTGSDLDLIRPSEPPPTSPGSSASTDCCSLRIKSSNRGRAATAESIAAMEAMLREIAREPGISVERIEEGSLRLIVRDPSAALEAIGAEKLRDEFKSRFSIQLLGFVPEHCLEELNEVAEELRTASHDLLRWPDTLPDGEQFERPELQQLLALTSARDRSAIAVIGDPGSGKSALLAMLGKCLVKAGHPVLAIKADLMNTEVNNEADLQERLGLSERPSSMLTRLSRLRPTFLLIDQLDALAGYLDLRTGRLTTLLNLVRRLGKTENIHIALSSQEVRIRTRCSPARNIGRKPGTEVTGVERGSGSIAGEGRRCWWLANRCTRSSALAPSVSDIPAFG